jgi:WD40 repeat protein
MSGKKIHLLDSISYNNKEKVFDIKFNPFNNNLGVVDVTGKLRLLKIEDDEIQKVKNFKVSEESIYSLDFSYDGENILCGTTDGELVIINNNKIIMRKKKAHEHTINKVKFLNEYLLTSSDSTGEIKIFDLRTKIEVHKFKEQDEEITEIEYSPNHNLILSTSIDGTLGVYDIRKEGKYKLYALSDNIEDEMYCMKIVKGGQKVACGTSEGPIALFNWDWFGDLKDRIMGHPGSVNTLEKYDENFLISGCEDGGIRFVSVNPKYIHSLITDKNQLKEKKNKIFNDINVISLDSDKRYLAVNTNIHYIKVFDISSVKLNKSEEELEEVEVNQEEEMNGEEDDMSNEDNESESEMQDEEGNEGEEMENSELNEELMQNEDANSEEDGDDVSDSDSDSDSSSKKKKSKKCDKSLKLAKNRNSSYLIEKEVRKDFFNDL